MCAGDAVTFSGIVALLRRQRERVWYLFMLEDDSATVGTPVFLLRNIKYEFKPSTLVPGGTGLYRTVVDAGTSEELSAPFASDASFKFFVGTALTAQSSPPADLSTLRGFELNMTGLSEKTPRQSFAQAPAPFVTAVFFKNRLN